MGQCSMPASAWSVFIPAQQSFMSAPSQHLPSEQDIADFLSLSDFIQAIFSFPSLASQHAIFSFLADELSAELASLLLPLQHDIFSAPADLSFMQQDSIVLPSIIF